VSFDLSEDFLTSVILVAYAGAFSATFGGFYFYSAMLKSYSPDI